MDSPKSQIKPFPPILVYYKTRGNAQIIRYLLFEMEVQFEEVDVSCETGIPKQIAEPYNLDINCIPYLIHEGEAICEMMAIVKYLCYRFERADLLGRNSQDEIKIMQVMVNFNVEKCKMNKMMLCAATQLMKSLKKNYTSSMEIEANNSNNQEQINRLKKHLLEYVNHLKHYQALKRMYLKSQNGYIMNYLTILDFVFYETCFYLRGLFSSHLSGDNTLPLLYCMFFEQCPFYLKNRARAEEYRIFKPNFDNMINEAIKILWEGDPRFIDF